MTKRSPSLRDLLAPLDGRRIPGGCEHCDAYQTVRPMADGIWACVISHDNSCPWYVAYQRRLGKSAFDSRRSR
jgi:ribosomal protein L37AE/L43A